LKECVGKPAFHERVLKEFDRFRGGHPRRVAQEFFSGVIEVNGFSDISHLFFVVN
jgi:hypothetical protein